jgi:glycosyltransferase involved in cell wall biosynthesis
MSDQPLVSIIIPTHNRAHLIGETLDSVLAQTYHNWECIIVDDGSSDNTDEVIEEYTRKDSRFKYYHRPDDHLPGGNGARNYGFKMSRGEYVNWFDSDDLMVVEKLELKVKAMLENEVDFVVSQTRYFNIKKRNPYSYPYISSDINFLNFATTDLSWFTPDLFIKRKILALNGIKFSEQLKAGQEYNFSCKLLLFTSRALKVKNILTLRRDHQNSIGKKRQQNKQYYWDTVFDLYWTTYNEVTSLNDVPIRFKRFMIYKCVRSIVSSKNKKKIPSKFHLELWKVFKLKSFYFYTALATNQFLGKSEYSLKRLKR